eukprot:290373_1
MGCCSTKEKGWTEQHSIVLDFMRGDGYLKTVWSAFKLNENDHNSMEYDEFCALLFIALEIYDKMQIGHSRQISQSMVEMNNILSDKYKRTKRDSLSELTEEELNTRGNIQQLQKTLDEIGPKLAVQFDKDGDGVFSWDEFKEFGAYLANEYQNITHGYSAPQINNKSDNANLLQKT